MELEKVLENYSGNLEKLVQYITGTTSDLVELEPLSLVSPTNLQEEINSRLGTLREFQKRRGSQLLKQVTEAADQTAFDTSMFAKSLMRESLQVNFLRKDTTELQEELNKLKELHSKGKNPMEKFVEEIQSKVGVEDQKLEIEDSIEMLLVKKVAALEKKATSKFKKEVDSVKHTLGVMMCDYLQKIEQLDLQCVSSKKLTEDTVQKLNHYMNLTRQFKKNQGLQQERYEHLTVVMSKQKEINYKVIRNLQKKLENARRQLAEQGKYGYLLSSEEGGRGNQAEEEEYEYYTQSSLPGSTISQTQVFRVGEDSSNLFDSVDGFSSRPVQAMPPAGLDIEEQFEEFANYRAIRKAQSPQQNPLGEQINPEDPAVNSEIPEGEFEHVEGRGALNILRRNEMSGAARIPKGMLERLQQLISELEEKERQLTEALKQAQNSEVTSVTQIEGGTQDLANPQQQGTAGEQGKTQTPTKNKDGSTVITSSQAAPVLKETLYKNDQKQLLLYIKQNEADRVKWANYIAKIQDLYKRTEADRKGKAQQVSDLSLRLSRIMEIYNKMLERNKDLVADGESEEEEFETKYARLMGEFEQLRSNEDNPVAKLQTQNSKLRRDLDDLRKELRFREDELALKKAEIRKLYEMSRFGPLTSSKQPSKQGELSKSKGQPSDTAEASVAQRLYAKTLQFNDDLKDQLMSQKRKVGKLEDELFDCKNREKRLEKKLHDLNGQQREVSYIVYGGRKIEIDDLEGLIDDLNNTLQRKQKKIENLQNELLEAQELMNISYQSEGEESDGEEVPLTKRNPQSSQFQGGLTQTSKSKISAVQEDEAAPQRIKKRRFVSSQKQEFQDYQESENLGDAEPPRRVKRIRATPGEPTLAQSQAPFNSLEAGGEVGISQPQVPTPVVPTRVVPVAPQFDPRMLERANNLQEALDKLRNEKRDLEVRSQQAIQEYKTLQDQNERLHTNNLKLQSQVASLQSQLLSNDGKVNAFAEQLIKVNRENEGLKLINSQLDQSAKVNIKADGRPLAPEKSEVWESMVASSPAKQGVTFEEDSLEETVIKVGKENQDLREKLRQLEGQLKTLQQSATLNSATIKGLEARITELGNELAMKDNQIKSFQTFNSKSLEKQSTTAAVEGMVSAVASPMTRKKDSVGVQVDTLTDLTPQVQQLENGLQEKNYKLEELRKQLEELTEQYEYSENCLKELRQTLTRVFAKKQYLINVLVNIEEDLYIGGRPIKRLDEVSLEKLLDEALEVVRGENQFRKSFTVPTKSSLDVVEIKINSPKQAEFEVGSAQAQDASGNTLRKLSEELIRLGKLNAELRGFIQEFLEREADVRGFLNNLLETNMKNDPQHAEDYQRLLVEVRTPDVVDEEDLRPSNMSFLKQVLLFLNQHPGRGNLVDSRVEEHNKQAFNHQEAQDATYDDELLIEVLKRQHEFQTHMESLLSQRLGSYRQTVENTRSQGSDMRKVQHIEKLADALEPYVSKTDTATPQHHLGLLGD